MQYHCGQKQSLSICRFNFTEIIGCNFDYSASTTSHQLLKSKTKLYQDLLPNSIGTNLTLLRKLLQHDCLYSLPKKRVQEYVLLVIMKKNKYVMF